MKYLIILLLVITQTTGPDIDLDREYKLAFGDSTPVSSLVRIQAKYSDGIPVNKGEISCLGEWYTHTEEDMPLLEAPWFPMDSRGAVMLIVNEQEVVEFDCQARYKKGKHGNTQFTIHKFGRYLKEMTIY